MLIRSATVPSRERHDWAQMEHQEILRARSPGVATCIGVNEVVFSSKGWRRRDCLQPMMALRTPTKVAGGAAASR